MWILLKKVTPNKIGIAGILIVITVFCSTSIFEDGTESDWYWIQLGAAFENLEGVEPFLNSLPESAKPETLKICMDESKFYVVHSGGSDKESLELIKEKLAKQLGDSIPASISQIKKTQCFPKESFFPEQNTAKAYPPLPASSKTMEKTPVHLQLNPQLNSQGAKPEPVKYNKKVESSEKKVLNTSPVQILPETTTQIYISNLDVNRISCMGAPVKDVVYSQEKGVTAKVSGSDVFVKLQKTQDSVSGEYRLVETPVELYVVCGQENEVYTLIGMPERIPAQWIKLEASGKKKLKENLSLFKGMPLEKKIITVMKQAYLGEYPDAYTVQHLNKEVSVYGLEWLSITQIKEVSVEGEGLKVKEYQVRIRETADFDNRPVLEKQFILPELAQRPIGITLNSLTLTKTEPAHLIIIEGSREASSIRMF